MKVIVYYFLQNYGDYIMEANMFEEFRIYVIFWYLFFKSFRTDKHPILLRQKYLSVYEYIINLKQWKVIFFRWFLLSKIH